MPKLIASYRVRVPLFEITPYTFIHRLFYFRCLMNDRYDFLTKYSLLDWAPLNEKPDNSVFQKSICLQDEIDKRAQYIIERADNKKIYLLYSGGVDSTCVATALIKNKKPNTKIEILCTKESLEEYSLFFDFFKKEHIKVNVMEFKDIFPYVEKDKDYVLTNGWCADQLFGFRDINKYKDLFFKDWTKFASLKFELDGNKDIFPYFKDSIEIIREYLNTVFPYPIKNFAQFAWFWNHCCKLSYIRNTTSLEGHSQYLRENNIPFYNCQNMIDWSVSNYDNFSNNFAQDTRYYKKPLKDYIIKYTKDENYRYKNKKTSWNPMYEKVTFNRLSVIDTEGFKYFGEIEQDKKYDFLLKRYNKYEV